MIVVGAAITLLVGYDIVALVVGGAKSTISSVMRDWAHELPILAYAWGVLGGHFFWGHPEPVTTETGDLVLLLFSVWVGVILNFAYQDGAKDLPLWVWIVIVMAGLVAGHFFWSQA